MDKVKLVNKKANEFLGFLDNTSIKSVLYIFFILYGSLIAPKLPSSVITIFNNVFFRIVILSLILYTSNKNIGLSILISVLFVGSIMFMNSMKILEKFGGIDESQNYVNQQFTDKLPNNDKPYSPIDQYKVGCKVTKDVIGMDVPNGIAPMSI